MKLITVKRQIRCVGFSFNSVYYKKYYIFGILVGRKKITDTEFWDLKCPKQVAVYK